MNEILGDPLEDDVLSGTLFSDSIVGYGGDDVIFGNNGDDTIDGGDGNDVLSGGIGDDTILGGEGKDVVELSAGDDVAIGGNGNDTYIVNGYAGDHVVITDTGGKADKLDFSGGITGATIDLTPGTLSYVDDRIVELTGVSEDSERPLELVLLQDLSGSFSDDIFTISGLKDDLVESLTGLTGSVELGLASFVDKPTSPFGSVGDYEYQTELALTSDFDAWKTAIDDLSIKSGNDGPESQLTGLMQVALREAEVGWSDGALKVVVLTTDAVPHMAGDNPVAPNDGDDVLDGPGNDGTGEDYPTIQQLKDALVAGGIIPIFAVTSSVIPDYEDIVDQLGFGSVVELSSDSSDIIGAIELGITTASETLIEKVCGTNYDDDILGNDADNTMRGKAGDDVINGGAGKDLIYGGDGEDLLKGGKGKDTLNGHKGSDDLKGGKGDDTFVFDVSLDTKKDTVQDYADGADSFEVLDVSVHSFADIGVRADGSDVILDLLGVDFARVADTSVADIDASDFTFGLA